MLFAGFSNGYTNYYCSFFDKKYFSYWTLLVKALLHCAIESTPSYLAAACIFGMIENLYLLSTNYNLLDYHYPVSVSSPDNHPWIYTTKDDDGHSPNIEKISWQL